VADRRNRRGRAIGSAVGSRIGSNVDSGAIGFVVWVVGEMGVTVIKTLRFSKVVFKSQ